MGTWGHKLYDDDVAGDARDAYSDLLSKGFDGPDATDRFLEWAKPAREDGDDGPITWFVLADMQWKLGRLEDRVRDKAIELIDDGASLDRWQEAGPQAAAARQKVLAELKDRLLSPQPPRKVIKLRKPSQFSTWQPGELFRLRLRSGRSVVLCLESVDEKHHAFVSTLDWIGDALPAPETLKALPRKPFRYEGYPGRFTHWQLIATRKRDVPLGRMTRLEIRIPIETGYGGRRCPVSRYWDTLDSDLEQSFGWT